MNRVLVTTLLPGLIVESRKYIDHANSSDRKWLGNHIFWAMRNNRSVRITPFSESN